MPWLDVVGTSAGVGELNGCLQGACALAEEETALWKPLVLLIPLRLGLSDINEAYIETLKVMLHLLQSLCKYMQTVILYTNIFSLWNEELGNKLKPE